MKEYFQLQFKMTNRKLTEFGVPPMLAYPILSFCFLFGSDYLFSSFEFANYAYILLVLWILLKFTDKRRNQFLKLCFSGSSYLKLRIFENVLSTLPFIVYLGYMQSFNAIGFVLILAVILVLVNLNTTLNFTLPTPFYKNPFEFIVGFRSSILFFPFAYTLTYISISVNNINLGIFSLLLVFMISMSFYSKLENNFFIWSFNVDPRGFLREKIKTGFWQVSILSLPIIAVLIVFFSSEWQSILAFVLLGYVYLGTLIVAKYSSFPHEMSMPRGILIGISFIFPPLLIGIIPYFYVQSLKRLNTMLQ